jgi:CheY-like chemotaxis protein
VTIPPLVLVIDDSGDTREVYAVLLRLEGFSVEGASDGREGLRKAAELRPDIIITDLSMPVMDGWQTIRRLRADERTRRIPIIACSGEDAPRGARLVGGCAPRQAVSAGHAAAEVRRFLRRNAAA